MGRHATLSSCDDVDTEQDEDRADDSGGSGSSDDGGDGNNSTDWWRAQGLVVVVDWDDTVLPRTPLARGCKRSELHALQADMLAMLNTLTQCGGTVVIVSAARRGHVQSSAAHHLPAVAAWLAAQHTHIVAACDDDDSGKEQAFCGILAKWRDAHGGSPPAAAVVIGDGVQEAGAARALARGGIPRVVIMKLQCRPRSCALLARQARLVAKAAPALLRAARRGVVQAVLTEAV